MSDNQMAGTEGQSLRLEAVKIKLSEELDIKDIELQSENFKYDETTKEIYRKLLSV